MPPRSTGFPRDGARRRGQGTPCADGGRDTTVRLGRGRSRATWSAAAAWSTSTRTAASWGLCFCTCRRCTRSSRTARPAARWDGPVARSGRPGQRPAWRRESPRGSRPGSRPLCLLRLRRGFFLRLGVPLALCALLPGRGEHAAATRPDAAAEPGSATEHRPGRGHQRAREESCHAIATIVLAGISQRMTVGGAPLPGGAT